MTQQIHNQSIDIAKGGLIFLVVLGHLLLGELTDNFARYFIYSFHMPMFIFISGFLIKREKLQDRKPLGFIIHYAKRMLGWWALAWCFYTGLSIAKDGDWGKITEYMIDPYYHLWYVPTLFCMIAVVYLLQKVWGKKGQAFWISLIVISVICKCTSWPSIANMGWMPYFATGVICGNITSLNVKKCIIGGGKCWLIYTIAIAAVFALPHESLYPLWAVPITLSLILFWLYPNLKEDSLPHSALLAYWGRHSLQIYLWHVFPIAVMKNLFEDSLIIYYIGGACLLGGFIISSKIIILIYKTKQ